MGQDLPDGVAAGVENGKEGVADGAFQRASGQAAIGFPVADLGFDGAAAAEVPQPTEGHTPERTDTESRKLLRRMRDPKVP